MTRLYYWIHHTGQCDRGTGVQRVVGALASALLGVGLELVPVRWCAEREAIVRAETEWRNGLSRLGGPDLDADEPGTPVHLSRADDGMLKGSWLLLPEVPHVGDNDSTMLPAAIDYARYYGLRTAIVFYDLIPLRFPGYEIMAPAHEDYARALVAADLVLPISQHSLQDLEQWWLERGYQQGRLPKLRSVLLPHEILGTPRRTTAFASPPTSIRFLALGTVEPRKNQVSLLRTFSSLCRRRPDLDIEIDVVGGLHSSVASEVQALADENNKIRLHNYIPEEMKSQLLRDCHATVFVSLHEGYGLPVAESLWYGKPCLCSNFGSMIEIADGGGCLMIDSRKADEIERGLEQLAGDTDLYSLLAHQARTRPLKTWDEYAREVSGAIDSTRAAFSVVCIEGSRASEDATDQFALWGSGARRLHWRPDTRALLPGSRTRGEPHLRGAGQLSGLWSILPLATVAGMSEALEIIEIARSLGLRIAVQASAQDHFDGSEIAILATGDLALFSTTNARDKALDQALRELPKTVNLRYRFRAINGLPTGISAFAESPALKHSGPPRRPRKLYYWVGVTVETPFNTGVQRVTRQLAVALGGAGIKVIPVKWDTVTCQIVTITTEEAAHLARWGGPELEAPHELPKSLEGEWLLVPEITVPVVPSSSNAARIARRLGMRVAAIFYDTIPLKMPEIYPEAALDHFKKYWEMFSEVDLALPISWTVSAELCHYLTDINVRVPHLVPCPLAGEFAGTDRRKSPLCGPTASTPLELLAVGTWEPRKNYPRLLRALAKARQISSEAVNITIVGRRANLTELDSQIERIAAEIGGVTLLDHVSDEELLELYDRCHVSVFASWEEGFGLPVVESLWRGIPCLCHDGSAIVELSPGGGLLCVDMLDEAAIARALVRLAAEEGLVERLAREAVSRPIRTWDDYTADVILALTDAATPPGWPLPMIAKRRPLLSCAITTYNRAPWLKHSLSRLLDATRPWRDVVEVVVCDNASTDDTPDVVSRVAGEPNFVARRNPVNVGMLGNLGATARACRGAYIWLLGDDDLIVDHALENVLEGLARYPDVEMAYMNYGYTNFSTPEELAHADKVVRDAKPIAEGGPNRRVAAVREVAGLNENLFTAIYACAFRRDHALRAYQQDVRGAPFSSLSTCVPSSTYALTALYDRPAWWVGEPAVIVNMNVSWLRWALLWHLERMPDLYDLAERAGIDPAPLDRYRMQHCNEAGRWAQMVYFEAEDAIREQFSMGRLLERCKHLQEFRDMQLSKLREVYEDAWNGGRIVADNLPPKELFSKYGFR